jgi:mono/diheme cytochrome c family protein
MRFRRAILVTIALGGLGLFVFLTSYWWFSQNDPTVSPSEAEQVSIQPLDSDQVAKGKAIYEANCSSCHGLEGEGSPSWQRRNPDDTYPPPPHDSSGHTWHHSDGLLYRIIKDGGSIYETPGFKSAMPAFGERLSPDEIRAVITYLKSLWGPEERAFQAQVSLDDPFTQDLAKEER